MLGSDIVKAVMAAVTRVIRTTSSVLLVNVAQHPVLARLVAREEALPLFTTDDFGPEFCRA